MMNTIHRDIDTNCSRGHATLKEVLSVRPSVRPAFRPSFRPAFRPSFRPSIHPSVTHESKSGKTSNLEVFWGRCVGGGAWGVDGGWMPLPTLPQRYCDPASLVPLSAFFFLVSLTCCSLTVLLSGT